MAIYNKNYSDYYDILYSTKDYKSETDFISAVLEKFSNNKDRKLLSLGCGTCNYEILLASKDYKIVGIDNSRQMLNIATNKIKSTKLESKIKVFKRDVRDFLFKSKFDKCMAMFNILGYQTEDEDIEKMFKNVSNNLKKGGIFIFDCWYMPAVLKDKPANRIKKVKTRNGQLIRLTKSVLKLKENLIDINFNVIEKVGAKTVNEAKETHIIRYWSLPELQYFLTKAGLSMVKACNFMDLKSEISENNWNVFIVARKE